LARFWSAEDRFSAAAVALAAGHSEVADHYEPAEHISEFRVASADRIEVFP